MIDRVSEERRSYIMSRVGSKDTGPEMIVRQLLHRLGYRYRLHGRDLPGSPDIVFRRKPTERIWLRIRCDPYNSWLPGFRYR